MVKKNSTLVIAFCLLSIVARPQADSSMPISLDFVSDTQQPLGVETIYRRPNRNLLATQMIFADILLRKPKQLFMLGDIVGLGYSSRDWRSVDSFLDSARKEGIEVHAVLGNHDVIVMPKKGEGKFGKRFPDQNPTGYTVIVDSIAVLLLNSNFSKLSTADRAKEEKWYLASLDSLDKNPGVKAIIVAAHHPIFTNSQAVKPSPVLRTWYLPAFIATRKCRLYISGHAHTFEHFRYQKKDFLVIGGGGGLHQPMSPRPDMPPDLAASYKPPFHYLNLQRFGELLQFQSMRLNDDFSTFTKGYSFTISLLP